MGSQALCLLRSRTIEAATPNRDNWHKKFTRKLITERFTRIIVIRFLFRFHFLFLSLSFDPIIAGIRSIPEGRNAGDMDSPLSLCSELADAFSLQLVGNNRGLISWDIRHRHPSFGQITTFSFSLDDMRANGKANERSIHACSLASGLCICAAASVFELICVRKK